MTCERVKTQDGGVAIICGRGRRAAPCEFCGRPHSKLCDFPIVVDGKPRTCDKRLCEECAVAQGPTNIDFCPPHDRNAVEIFSRRESQGLNPDGTPKSLFDGPEFTDDLRVGSKGIE